MGNRLFRLGELQLKILKVLWGKSPLSVNEIHQALPQGKTLAATTVSTMLRKMEDRKMVQHITEGRKFLYEPLLTEEDTSRSIADHLLSKVFEGSLAGMVSHLLDRHKVTKEDLDQISKLIARHKAKGTDQPR